MYNIKELHKVQLEIADEIHRICVKNKIEYSLNGGTLLGAVRHQGFIPWDDDFDLGMTRLNYNVFLEALKEDLSSQFDYISMHKSDLYSVPFLKVLKKGTLLREAALPDAMKGYGIFVDVFPYDNVPKSKVSKLYHRVSTDIYFRLLLAKSKYNLELKEYSLKHLIYSLFQGLSVFIPRRFLVKRLEAISTKHNEQIADDLTTIGGPYGYRKEVIPVKLFKSLALFQFENRHYYGFSDYKENLTFLYGDYMKYPPAEERFNRHAYEFVDFGE